MHPRSTIRMIAGLAPMILTMVLATMLCGTMPGATAYAQNWSVSAGAENAKIYLVPPPAPGALFSQILYEEPTRRLYLDFLYPNFPAGAQHQFYALDLKTMGGTWLDPGIAPGATQQYAQNKPVPLPLFSTSGVLSSQMIRAAGAQDIDQPYGEYQAKLLIREEAYIKKSAVIGTGTGKARVYERTLGRGDAIVELHDKGHRAVLSFRQPYIDNTAPVPVMWTPDGRYLLATGTKPDGGVDLVVTGPFAVTLDAGNSGARMAWPVRLYDRAAADRRFADGTLSATDHYGRALADAMRRIERCDPANKITGKLQSLTLPGLASVVEFSDDLQAVGQFYTLAYSAAKHSGTMIIASPVNGASTGSRTRYKDIFESVTITTSEGKKDVLCP